MLRAVPRTVWLFLLAAALAAQQPAANPQAAKCILSGSVVDANTGLPLTKVSVKAESLSGGGGPQAASATDAKGDFKIVDLEPGQYKLHADRNGYLPGAYGAKRAGAAGSAISSAAGEEVKDLQIRMFPFGVIAGTVRDPDGEPLVGIEVVAFRQTYSQGKRSADSEGPVTHTDDLGQYRIPNLPPGKYYVQADLEKDLSKQAQTTDHFPKDNPKQILVSAFHPGVTDPNAAQPVQLDAGAKVAGVDITMIRSRVVRVRIKVAAPPKTEAHAKLVAGRADDHLGWREIEGERLQNGEFELRDVTPGSYTVVAEASAPSPPPTPETFTPGTMMITVFRTSAPRATMPLEVGNNDIEGLQIAIGAPAEVKGRIVVLDADGKPAKQDAPKPDETGGGDFPWFGSVDFEDNSAEPPTAPLQSDRTFAAQLSPGRYTVYPGEMASERNLVIQSIKSEQLDVLRDGLTITGPGPVPLEITLAPDGGTVDGNVTDKDRKPVAGATVALIPSAEWRGRHDRYFDATADQYGHYEFKNVPPGDYKILAWDDIEPDVWYDPDFLRGIEAKADSVTLKAKGHETVRVHIQQ